MPEHDVQAHLNGVRMFNFYEIAIFPTRNQNEQNPNENTRFPPK